MRRIAFAAALIAACAPQTADVRTTPPASAAGTATPRPTPTPEAVRYVAIGASDTVGVGASDPLRGSWPARLASRLPSGSAYVNVGVSGSLAREARTAQLPRAIAERPTVVTVWLAVNDIMQRIPPPEYARDLAAVLDPLVERTSARVFVGTVPDLRAVPAFGDVDRAQLAEVVRGYNAVIGQVAARHAERAVVVDLFTGSADLVSSLTVADDGLHPTDRGYELIADRFAAALRAAGIAVR